MASWEIKITIRPLRSRRSEIKLTRYPPMAGAVLDKPQGGGCERILKIKHAVHYLYYTLQSDYVYKSHKHRPGEDPPNQ